MIETEYGLQNDGLPSQFRLDFSVNGSCLRGSNNEVQTPLPLP